MKRRILTLGAVALFAASSVFGARVVLAPTYEEFEDLELTLHANVTDEELAVILALEVAEEIMGVDVHDPAGNHVFHLRAAHPLGVGLHEAVLESKLGIAEGLAAFPEGTYRVIALTPEGGHIQGLAYLSHALPARPTFLSPREVLPNQAGGLDAYWNPTETEELVIEFEGETFDVEAVLPGHLTTYGVPASVLVDEESVKVALTAVHESGNRVSTEVVFDLD